MSRLLVGCLILAAVLIFIPNIFAQEELAETQWVWGEVVSVDAASNQISVKYLDYETDEEKEMSLSIDPRATFENVSTLDELKSGDSVSIDYIINKDGKNVAKVISVEKPEDTEIETKPEELEPKETEEEKGISAPIETVPKEEVTPKEESVTPSVSTQ